MELAAKWKVELEVEAELEVEGILYFLSSAFAHQMGEKKMVWE